VEEVNTSEKEVNTSEKEVNTSEKEDPSPGAETIAGPPTPTTISHLPSKRRQQSKLEGY
jgi:hypothetical protein